MVKVKVHFVKCPQIILYSMIGERVLEKYNNTRIYHQCLERIVKNGVTLQNLVPARPYRPFSIDLNLYDSILVETKKK